jgi:hypothetical protein
MESKPRKPLAADGHEIAAAADRQVATAAVAEAAARR